MFSAKLIALFPFLGALAAAKSPPNTSAEFSLEPFKSAVLLSPETAIWPGVEADLKVLFPGISCQLAAEPTEGKSTPPSKRLAAPNADCQAIEDNLSHLFPTISCSGTIDWDELDATVERLFDPSPSPSSSSSNNNALQSRQSRNSGHVTNHRARTLREVAAEERRTITSCSRAPRPGNCRICATGYAVAAAAEVGVCAAAAYAAAAASGGVLAAPAWAAFTACGAKVVASLVASLTACWGR